MPSTENRNSEVYAAQGTLTTAHVLKHNFLIQEYFTTFIMELIRVCRSPIRSLLSPDPGPPSAIRPVKVSFRICVTKQVMCTRKWRYNKNEFQNVIRCDAETVKIVENFSIKTMTFDISASIFVSLRIFCAHIFASILSSIRCESMQLRQHDNCKT